MAMNAGWVDVTLASGVGTGNWRHPEQVRDGSNADTVELDARPEFYGIVPSANNLAQVGVVKVEAISATAVRLVSTHNSDSSTYRVWALVKMPEAFWRAG